MAELKKLVFLCNSPAVMAGVEKTVLLVLEHINRTRFDIRFILNGEGPFAEALRQRGADLEIIPCGRRMSRAWKRALVQSLKRRPADVVQLHLSRLNAPLLHRCGARVVERLNMNRHTAFRYPLQWPWLDRLTARWIDHFVVVSEALKLEFVERGYDHRKMSVVHNGIASPDNLDRTALRRELGLSDSTLLIGSIGRLTHQKGMDTFIAAAKLVLAKRPDVHVVIAGDGELREELKRQVQENELTDKVTFLGFRSDALNVIAGLDLMVYLSRWEPFANTILEAMAVGTPMVASNAGGNAEAITDNHFGGTLVPPDDPEETALAIESLLDSPERRHSLIESGRQRTALFTIEKMVQGHMRVYEGLARRLVD